MENLSELINSNTATFYLIIYLVLLLGAGISILIYETCVKKKTKEDRSVFVSPADHKLISRDIMVAENFGNEPLSNHGFHTVIKNGSISRMQKNVCLVDSLPDEKGYDVL